MDWEHHRPPGTPSNNGANTLLFVHPDEARIVGWSAHGSRTRAKPDRTKEEATMTADEPHYAVTITPAPDTTYRVEVTEHDKPLLDRYFNTRAEADAYAEAFLASWETTA